MPDYIDHRKVVREWLVNLAALLPEAGSADLSTRIDQYADVLVAKVPIDLFTSDSVEFCARKIKQWPSYAVLWARLQVWQRERPKDRPALTGAPGMPDIPEHLSATDRAVVRSWWNLRAENIANGTMKTALGIQRRHFPVAFRVICSLDTEAAAIAVRNGWREAEADGGKDAVLAADWGSMTEADLERHLANIRALAADSPKTAQRWLGILRTAVEKYAPQFLAMVPERLAQPAQQRQQERDPWAEVDLQRAALGVEPAVPPPPPKAFPLDDAHLEALRDANPLIQASRVAQAAEKAAKPPVDETPAPGEWKWVPGASLREQP